MAESPSNALVSIEKLAINKYPWPRHHSCCY